MFLFGFILSPNTDQCHRLTPAGGAPVPPVHSRTRAGCLGLCPAVAWKHPGREMGSVYPPPANFLHVRAIHNTPENHDSITAAIKTSISHQPIQLSFAIMHFSSLFYLSFQNSLLSYFFSPYQSASHIPEGTYHPDRRNSAVGIYTPGYSSVPFIWKCKAALISARSPCRACRASPASREQGEGTAR